LIVDPRGPAILGRIGLPSDDGLPARPTAMARFGSTVAVTLQRLSADFSEQGDSWLVGVSPESDEVVWQIALEGLRGCGAPVVAPDGKRAAIACSGRLDPDGNVTELEQSGLLLLDLSASPPSETARFAARDLASEAVQSSAEFASDSVLLFKTQTPFGGASHNRWLALDLETGAIEELAAARPDTDGAGQGLVFGGTWCAPGCSDTCLLADADRGVIQRMRLEAGEAVVLEPIVVETRIGLPPRYFGAF
jgi:hypothetical protein